MIESLQVMKAEGERLIPALEILFSRFPADERQARQEDTLLAVRRGALNLSQLWLAEWQGQPAGAALVMHQPDGVSLVWPPVVLAGYDPVTIRSELMDVLCRELNHPGVKFGQCLLSPDEFTELAWLADYGFDPTAELFFLARALDDTVPEQSAHDHDHEVVVFEETSNAGRFADVIERTYIDSLDCPRLNGTRTGVDAIAGHRLSGEFHPRGWLLYRAGGRDAAVLLLNEHPDQDAVELVYFGVVPEFRGRKMGQRLLSDALSLAKSWRRAVLFLAVDAGNTFANQLYAEAGFQEVARRGVWLRFPATTARK